MPQKKYDLTSEHGNIEKDFKTEADRQKCLDEIDIYYHGIGYVFIPEPEEVEEMFQEHLRDRKDNIKVKTA